MTLLELPVASFMVIDPGAAPAAVGLHAAYETMHARLVGLLTQASTEFDRMARALRHSAEAYEQSDRNAAGRMEGIW